MLLGILKKLAGQELAGSLKSTVAAQPAVVSAGSPLRDSRIQNFPSQDMVLREGLLTDPTVFDVESMSSIHSFTSEACRLEHFLAPRYRYWCERLKEYAPRFHRKQWEWVYICAVLYERGMLQPGRRGLGFGVGQEPLADLFASMGVSVVATDQAPETAIAGGWTTTGQHSTGLTQLRQRSISTPEDFDARVSFRHADMNAIDADLFGFDFNWSSCCYEHLGSIEHGLAFVRNSMKTLKRGGISVHTTELNLTSDVDTYETEHLCVFRRKDFKRLAAELRAEGNYVSPLCFYPGAHPVDNFVDLPPYKNDPHLRLDIAGFASTSFGMIVQKG